MSFFKEIFQNEYPYYNQEVKSLRQMIIDENQNITKEDSDFTLKLTKLNIIILNNNTMELLKYSWSYDKNIDANYVFTDENDNQWIVGDNIITWTIVGTGKHISFILNK